MKLKITLAAMEGSYTTVFSKEVAMELPDDMNFGDVRNALVNLVEQARVQHVLRTDDDDVLSIMIANKVKEAKSIGHNEGKAEATVSTEPSWKLTSKISELERELKQKSCQIDGLIRGINPDYDPNPDGEERLQELG